MRIIGGSAKGHILKMPKGGKTRPAMSRVKESLFSILAARLPDGRILDLFAGSGSVGIEALSRGASLGVFVDSSHECTKVIKENLEKTKLVHLSKIYQQDCLGFLQNHPFDPFDLVFIDPPYFKGLLEPLLDIIPLCSSFNERTIFIIERQKKDDLHLETRPFLKLVDERIFGATVLSIFKKS